MGLSVALLTVDNRENDKEYSNPVPVFGTAPAALLQGFSQLPGLKVHVVSCTQRPMRGPEKLADNIWFHSLHVPKFGWLKTGYQGCIRAVRVKLKEIQPDIVHGQGTERDCALSAIFSGFPNVVTIHGNMRAVARILQARIGSYHWLASKLEDYALPRTHGVFCNSGYTEQMVLDRAGKVWRVPNAIREEFFTTPPKGIHTKSPILLNIGVVTPYKRQIEILSVARKLHESGREFRLDFIGSVDAGSSYGQEFLSLVRQAESAGYAQYLGRKSVAELIECLDAASAMVHLPTEESFGLVVAEGLSRNLKLFASRTGGVPDIASGVEGAELFNEFKDVVPAIGNWLDEGAFKPSIAGEEMKRRYHPIAIATKHVEIYQEVLQSGKGSAGL